jgi:Glycosyltransferase family 28 N-terminal domain
MQSDLLGADDGRVNIKINQKSRKLSAFLATLPNSRLHTSCDDISEVLAGADDAVIPALNIVMHVVGSRGDVQPFVSLGQLLKNKYGHRVRLATHPIFKQLVEENGLEFFSIGGDPAKLMAFMVKNPGLMPGYDSIRHGDVGDRRKEMSETLLRCWRSCVEAGNGIDSIKRGAHSTEPANFNASTSVGVGSSRPFVADAIIANPPSFAHIHCAEKLGIPLQLMFT